MRAWVALVLLLLAWPAMGETPGRITLALIGDPQEGVRCDNVATAWAHWVTLTEHVAAQAGTVDLAIFTGDLVDGRGYNTDCWCGAQAPGCEGEVHPYLPAGEVCNAAHCNDAQSTACVGGQIDGAGGWWCEWERIRAVVDGIQDGGSGVPTAVANGNHDNDWPISNFQEGSQWEAYGYQRWEDYNEYFGPPREVTLKSMVADLDFYLGTMASGTTGVAGTAVEGPYGISTVVNAGGTQLLHLSVPYMNKTYLLGDPYAEWIQAEIDEHPGMLTFITTHMASSHACSDATYALTYCRDVWTKFTGKALFPILKKNPQILAVFGGHNRTIFRNTWAHDDGWKILNVAFDYSFAIGGGTPPSQAWQIPDNGGGGVVSYITFSLTTGHISAMSYSPEQADYVHTTTVANQESRFLDNIPICRDDTGRWSLPDSACPEQVPPTNALGR